MGQPERDFENMREFREEQQRWREEREREISEETIDGEDCGMTWGREESWKQTKQGKHRNTKS